jgi:hypothetical protein
VNFKEYGSEFHAKLSATWEPAQKAVKQAQKKQKYQYDCHVTSTFPFREGERVVLYKPGDKTAEARMLALPFHGPYNVQETGTNTAAIIRVDRPKEEPVLVLPERLLKSWVMSFGCLTRE